MRMTGVRRCGGAGGEKWSWAGTATVEPAMLIQQARKGILSSGAGSLRVTVICCRKPQHGFVTWANNSWQVKLLNNCLSTYSSLQKECQEERLGEHPLLWKGWQWGRDVV